VRDGFPRPRYAQEVKERQRRLKSEVLDAMTATARKMELVLAYEMRGVGQEDRAAIDFDELFAAGCTPGELVTAGLYTQIATSLKGGPWRLTSLYLLGKVIASAYHEKALKERRVDATSGCCIDQCQRRPDTEGAGARTTSFMRNVSGVLGGGAAESRQALRTGEAGGGAGRERTTSGTELKTY